MKTNIIYQGDALELAKQLPDKYVNCIVTSPPYYGLRDYGMNEQIGLEDTPKLYIEKLVGLFREIRRGLRDDGTLWLNIGDSYCSQGGGQVEQSLRNNDNYINSGQLGANGIGTSRKSINGLKPKDLIGIPWMLAFALRADGWYLRQDIIWNKPNPMPESVTDRCTKSHEYIFLLSKSNDYYFEQILEPANYDGRKDTMFKGGVKYEGFNQQTMLSRGYERWQEKDGVKVRNKRSVWTVTTKPTQDCHFATYPQELIIDCIKAGCPECGVVLDPFMGAGTTAIVARKLNRNYTGFELNPEYIKISNNRLHKELGMFI